MIEILFSLITFGIGGGGGVSPPQWFYSISGHIYFLEEGFEPSLNIEYSRFFNHPLLHPVNNYDSLRINTYYIKVSIEYPFFIRGFFISPCLGTYNISQIQKIWRGYEYFMEPVYKKGYFYRLSLGKVFDQSRIFLYYEWEQRYGGYAGFGIRRVLK